MSTNKEVTQQDQDALDAFLNQIFHTDQATALQLVQQALNEVEQQAQDDNARFMTEFLSRLWDFFKAFILVKENADFGQAQGLLQRASEGFQQLGLEDLQKLSFSWLLYFSAIVDLRTLNLSAGLEKIKEARKHFNNLDQFGEVFGEQRDAMEAESLFISGMSYFTQLDYDNGYIAVGKAARSYRKVAQTYYGQEDAEYKLYMGFGYVYSAFGHFFGLWERLNRFDFDFFDDPENQTQDDYQKAIKFLSEVGSFSEIARVNLKLAKGLDLLSQVLFYIGDCMHDVLAGRPDDRKLDIKLVRRKLDNARQFFEDIGELGIVYFRLCKQVQNQLRSVGHFLRRNDVAFAPPTGEAGLAPRRVKELVGQGKNRQALEYLLEHTDELDIYDAILAVKGGYEEFRREVVKGLLSAEERQRREAVFAERILEILKHL